MIVEHIIEEQSWSVELRNLLGPFRAYPLNAHTHNM